MKAITEFTGSLIRTASKAAAEARKALPKAEPVKPAEEAPAAAPQDVEARAAEAAPAEAAPAEAPAVEAAPAAGEDEAANKAVEEAINQATGISGDRLARLREAVTAVGKRTDDVRLVIVYGPEDKVAGAKTVGGFQYAVEYLPASMKQVMTKPERERGGRGGRPGGGRPSGGGKAAETGGFSMDAVKADRAAERRPGGGRGGRPGGGRGGRPGGGRPGGGGPRGS